MISKGDTVSSPGEALSAEVRRGMIAVAVLAQCRTAQYGYSLKQSLAEAGFEVNEGTLYPLMRRLEEQGLLASEWRIADEGRPRRYYIVSKVGVEALEQVRRDWGGVAQAMNDVLEGGAADEQKGRPR